MPALVVNADDLGVSRGATLGIVKAHQEGVVTSASLAVTTPHYEHALKLCQKDCPELGLGLHFTLSAGRPVCPAADVPLLVDERGYFSLRFVPLLLASWRTKGSELHEQIELELEAQLQRATRDGVSLDHIDSERHVHLIPGIFELVVAAARRHDIPYVRWGRDAGWRYVNPKDLGALIGNGGFLKSALLSGLSWWDRRRCPEFSSSAHVASYLYAGRLDLLLSRLIARPPAEGVTEIVVHPGIPEESRDADVGNDELQRYLVDAGRGRELEACISARELVDRTSLRSFGQLARQAEAAAR
jgi:predicted glycoside hydrolase/deacetylase ChbG (UPF0249 family)